MSPPQLDLAFPLATANACVCLHRRRGPEWGRGLGGCSFPYKDLGPEPRCGLCNKPEEGQVKAPCAWRSMVEDTRPVLQPASPVLPSVAASHQPKATLEKTLRTGLGWRISSWHLGRSPGTLSLGYRKRERSKDPWF